MSKAETLRQSAIDKNKSNLEQLAEQVQTIRDAKAQSVEELSAMLEPLAQALATLSSEAAETLRGIELATRTASGDYQRQINAANDSLGRATAATTQATAALRRAASSLSWGHYSLAMVTGLVTAALVSGFWLWFRPPKVELPLDPKAVAEYLKPALVEAMKTGKEPAKPAKSR